MSMARGVRKVNENIVQDGRALIITEEDASKLKWENIPDGTIKVNKQNGLMMVKLQGESDWLPAGLKNDGTLCIIKDSMIIHEAFTVTNVPSLGTDGKYTTHEFSYTNSDGETRHMPITDGNEFVFEVEKGSFIKGRNALTVTIDDCLDRTPASGGVRELSETRFALADALEVGHEITAKYTRIFRIGNPYPRVFMDNDEPEASELGDFWVDLNADFSDNDLLGDGTGEVNTTIDWSRITGKPTSISGYKITDKISYEGHLHQVKDITDFPKSMPANGGNADTTDGYHVDSNKPNTLAVINPDGKLSYSVMPSSVVNGVDAVGNFYVGTTVPNSPVNGKTIWFCIDTTGGATIKFYANNKWNTFGAVFL